MSQPDMTRRLVEQVEALAEDRIARNARIAELEATLAEAVRLLRENGSCDPYSGQPYDDVVAFLASVDA